jgi:subtilase family serine protease
VVGGTTLYLNASGQYQSETVWNDNSIGAGAGGGGVSELFPIPDYQQFGLPSRTRSILAGHRGVPDVSYNADDANSAIFVYTSFLGAAYGPAAVGFLNPKLYALRAARLFPVFGHGITQGNNSYGGVPGYSATPGWDPASGWGTPKFNLLPEKRGQFNAAQ